MYNLNPRGEGRESGGEREKKEEEEEGKRRKEKKRKEKGRGGGGEGEIFEEKKIMLVSKTELGTVMD